MTFRHVHLTSPPTPLQPTQTDLKLPALFSLQHWPAPRHWRCALACPPIVPNKRPKTSFLAQPFEIQEPIQFASEVDICAIDPACATPCVSYPPFPCSEIVIAFALTKSFLAFHSGHLVNASNNYQRNASQPTGGLLFPSVTSSDKCTWASFI